MQFNLLSFDRQKMLYSKLGEKRFPVLGTSLWYCTRIQVRFIKKSPRDTLVARKQRVTQHNKKLRKINISMATSFDWRRKENSIDPFHEPITSYICHVGPQVGHWGIQKKGTRTSQDSLSYILDAPLLNFRSSMADFAPYHRVVRVPWGRMATDKRKFISKWLTG